MKPFTPTLRCSVCGEAVFTMKIKPPVRCQQCSWAANAGRKIHRARRASNATWFHPKPLNKRRPAI